MPCETGCHRSAENLEPGTDREEFKPRVRGQTIVVSKSHRADCTERTPEETASCFTLCTHVANAIKAAFGAEKVYLVTMCDGGPNHLHIQLLPRYAGERLARSGSCAVLLLAPRRGAGSRHPRCTRIGHACRFGT